LNLGPEDYPYKDLTLSQPLQANAGMYSVHMGTGPYLKLARVYVNVIWALSQEIIYILLF